MPGNDLTSLRDIVPVAATQQATARADITTILNGILNDIEPKVTPAGLDMSSALSFLSGGVYSPITNLGYLNMEDRSATPAVNESLYVTANELYFRDGSGNDVAITSGGSVSAAAGNITGAGYGSPVEVNWNTATAEYRMKSGSGTHSLADVVMDRAQFSDGSAYFATLGATAGMAATLAYSLPVAFPASTSAMTMTSAGGMSHTRDLSIDTVTASGDMTADDYKITGTKTLVLDGSAWVSQGTGGSHSSNGNCNSVANGYVFLAIPLTVGDQVTNIQVFASGDLAGTLTLTLHTKSEVDGSVSAAIATDTDTTVSPGVTSSLTLASLTTTLADPGALLLRLKSDNASAITTVYHAAITYDRP